MLADVSDKAYAIVCLDKFILKNLKISISGLLGKWKVYPITDVSTILCLEIVSVTFPMCMTNSILTANKIKYYGVIFVLVSPVALLLMRWLVRCFVFVVEVRLAGVQNLYSVLIWHCEPSVKNQDKIGWRVTASENIKKFLPCYKSLNFLRLPERVWLLVLSFCGFYD